ncbi:Trifunctional nucleotide phosphoesterase protein YfkN precursor [compost metagenome]
MPERLQRLVVLHTNDIHSHFEQMPKVAAFFDQVKGAVAPELLLTVDIGDHMDRMRPETEGTSGRANIDIMNATGYEAFVLGNNEGLTFTSDVLEQVFREHAQFTVLGSNMLDAQTGQIPDWMVPYLILDKAGIRVGLIGVTAVYKEFYELLGWQVTDPIEATAYYAKLLRPQVDVLIVMSHLGLRMDERMANELEGIDLILGGHTHHLLEEPLLIGSTYLCGAGKFGRYVGHVEIEFDKAERRIHGVNGRVVDLTDAKSSSSILMLLEAYKLLSHDALDIEVAKLALPLHLEWSEESQLGNLLAAGLRAWTGAEIGLVNAGQLLQGLKEGRVTRGRLLEICPGPINPCRIRLSGINLLQALEESLLSDFKEKVIYGFGFRGEVLGMLCLDGIQVTYDPARAPYTQIVEVTINGSPIELQREYLIGTIDMFTFGAGYLSLSKGTSVEYLLPDFLRDVLAAQLHNQAAIDQSIVLNKWIKRA